MPNCWQSPLYKARISKICYGVENCVSKLGKTSIIFVDEGAKVDAKYYKDHLLAVLVPDMSNLAGNDHSMCSYKMPQELIQSKKTLEYLNKNFPDYIKPSSWPPTVPTLILWIILFKAKKQCFQQKKLSILNSWKREFNWVLGRIPPRRDWQGNWFIQSSP